MTANGSFAPECTDVRPLTAKGRCYAKALLAAVEASGDPAREVPRLDAQTRAAGGFVAAACHVLMHSVGRTYTRRHRVTLATLQRYLPRSNDSGCSAGFGHGLIMALGPQIMRAGPEGALKTCLQLATRVRQYTCVHGLGHAYMRMFSDDLKYALPRFRALGPAAAPDCAQGAFHDYWISRSGGTARRRRLGRVPRRGSSAVARKQLSSCRVGTACTSRSRRRRRLTPQRISGAFAEGWRPFSAQAVSPALRSARRPRIRFTSRWCAGSSPTAMLSAASDPSRSGRSTDGRTVSSPSSRRAQAWRDPRKQGATSGWAKLSPSLRTAASKRAAASSATRRPERAAPWVRSATARRS